MHSASAPVSLAFGLRFSTEPAGIPGFRVIFFKRAVNRDPAECAVLICHQVRTGAVVFQQRKALDTRDVTGFGAYFSRLTCSRAYASPRSLPTPSQGSLPACLAGLTGRVSHPQDDASVFLLRTRTSLSHGPALPGRTPLPCSLLAEADPRAQSPGWNREQTPGAAAPGWGPARGPLTIGAGGGRALWCPSASCAHR